jgi:heme-degrading monooxygenase HmoA
MYVRATWFESSSDQLEERIANYPRRMQSIRDAPGCVGIGALVNRQTGAGASVTYWDSAESMQASRGLGEQVRAQALADGGIQLVGVDEFELVLQDRVAAPNSGTFIRTTDFVAPPDKIDALVEVLRSRLPEGRKLPGFRALLVSANRDTGRMLISTIWNTAADREASVEMAAKVRDELAPIRGDSSVKIELYEVVYADVKLPATV